MLKHNTVLWEGCPIRHVAALFGLREALIESQALGSAQVRGDFHSRIIQREGPVGLFGPDLADAVIEVAEEFC
jgi:hypothetical protein